MPVSLGVVVPALNAAGHLPACLKAIRAHGPDVTLDLVVVDGGSSDATVRRAGEQGARVVRAPPGRGVQLAAGAAAARGDWFLFVHADTVLQPGWAAAVNGFAADPANAGRAGYGRLALDDERPEARRLEAAVAWRCRAFGLPYGDQALLIGRALHDRVGGFRPLPLMEDVDLARRLGRARLTALPMTALTSAARYRRDGYLRRSCRNLACLGLYLAGLPPRAVARLYG